MREGNVRSGLVSAALVAESVHGWHAEVGWVGGNRRSSSIKPPSRLLPPASSAPSASAVVDQFLPRPPGASVVVPSPLLWDGMLTIGTILGRLSSPLLPLRACWGGSRKNRSKIRRGGGGSGGGGCAIGDMTKKKVSRCARRAPHSRPKKNFRETFSPLIWKGK